MSTKFRVYAGDSIAFYSATLGDKSATLSLDSNDILQIGSTVGGIAHFNETSQQKLGIAEIVLASKVSGTGVWNAEKIAPIYGGTGLTIYDPGDIIYASAVNTLAVLNRGNNGAFLNLNGGLPRWGNTISQGGLTVASGGANIIGNVEVTGNLSVTGNFTQTTISAFNMIVSDNSILLNSPAPATVTFDSGIQIDVGTAASKRYMTIGTIGNDNKWYIGATSTLLGLNSMFIAADIAEIATVGQWSNGTAQSISALYNKTYSSNNAIGLTLTPSGIAGGGFSIQGGPAVARTLTVNTGNITLSASNRTLTLVTNLTVNTGDLVLQANASGTTAIFPATGTITLVDLGTAQTLSGAKTITGGLILGSGTAVANNITGTGHYQAGTIVTTFGGTGLSSYTNGDMLYWSTGNTFTRLAAPTDQSASKRYVMQALTANTPSWQPNLDLGTSGTIASGDITTAGNITLLNTRYVGNASFASGFAGHGWRIGPNGALVGGITAVTVGSPGNGYAIGDILLITQAGGSTGKVRVTNVSAGAVSGIQLYDGGSGYSTGSNLATVRLTGNGSNCTVSVTGIAVPSAMDIDHLTVRGSMRVYELLINQIRATNGSVFVTAVGKIRSATQVSGTVGTNLSVYTFITDDNTTHGFAGGDLIRAQRWINGTTLYQVNMKVLSSATTPVGDNPTLSTFVAQLQGANSYIDSVAAFAGMDFVRIGNDTNSTRRGCIYLTSDDSNAPFIDILDGVSSHTNWNSVGNVKVRLGNLSGITDHALGLNGGTQNYGLFSWNAYLKGNLIVGGSDTTPITAMNGLIAIGNVTGVPTGVATGIKIAMTALPESSGIFGYSSGSTVSFSLPLAGTATIAGWNFDSTKIYNSGTVNVTISNITASPTIGDIVISGGDGNIYLSNNIVLAGTTVTTPSSNTIKIDGVANSIRIGSSAILSGLNSGSFALGSATSATNGTGIWMEGGGVFRVGTGTLQRLFWNGSNLLIYGGNGSLVFQSTAGGANIGGWFLDHRYIYNLMSGLPGSSPSEGLVLDGQDACLLVYDLTTKRVELGRLSANVYGIKGYSSGSTSIFEISNVRNIIAGWTITTSALFNNRTGLGASIAGIYIGTDGIEIGTAQTAPYFSATLTGGILAGWRYDDNTLWAGSPAKDDIATTICMIQSTTPVNAMFKLGAKAFDITIEGNQAGIAMDGRGQFKVYGSATDFIRMTSTGLEIRSRSLFLTNSGSFVLNALAGAIPYLAFGPTSAPTARNVGEGIYIDQTGIYCGENLVTPAFSLTSAGALTALNATISGTITANTGNIGGPNGWTIGSNFIRSVSANNYISGGNVLITAPDTASSTGFYLGGNGSFRLGTYAGTTLVRGLIFNGGRLVINSPNFRLDANPEAGNLDSFWAKLGGFGGSFTSPALALTDNGIRFNDGFHDKLLINNLTNFRPHTAFMGTQKIFNGTFEEEDVPVNWVVTGGASNVVRSPVGHSAPYDENYIEGEVATRSFCMEFRAHSTTASTNLTHNGGIAASDIGKTFTVTWHTRFNGFMNYNVYIIKNPSGTAHSWNGHAWVLGTNNKLNFLASGNTWVKNSFNFVPDQPVLYLIRFEVPVAPEAILVNPEGSPLNVVTQSNPLRMDHISVRTHANFVEMNAAGLQIYTSPTNYLKVGKPDGSFSGFELKAQTVDFQELTISNTLKVYGPATFYGPVDFGGGFSTGPGTPTPGASSSSSAIQILNYNASTATELPLSTTQHTGYYGLEIGASGDNPMLVFYGHDSRWYLTTRASNGTVGGQTNAGNVEVLFNAANTIMTPGTTDVITGNKTFSSGTFRLNNGSITTLIQGNTSIVNGCTLTMPTQVNTNDRLISLSSVDNVTGVKSFNAGTLQIFNVANEIRTIFATMAATTNKTITFPDATDTVAVLNTIQTFTALKTFNAGVTIGNSSALTVAAGGSISFPTNSITNAAIATINTAGKIAANAITTGVTHGLSTINGVINDIGVETILGSAYFIGSAKLRANAVYVTDFVVGSAGIPAGTAVTLPNSQSYRVKTNIGTILGDTKLQWLQVHVDGRLQRARYINGAGTTYDYEETSSTSITFSYPLPENANITFTIYAG